MAKFITRLREMRKEWVDKARSFGWNLDAELVEETTCKEEAYALGRVEQIDSILEEFPE